MLGLVLAFLLVSPAVLFGPSAVPMHAPSDGRQLPARSGATAARAPSRTNARVNARTPAGQDAAGLQLRTEVFAPATIATSTRRASNDMDNTQLWPRLHHSASYASWGLSGSYFQHALWTPSGSTESVTFDYAGSVLATEPGAYDAWHDGTTYWPFKYNNIQLVSCPAVAAPDCSRWDLTGNNGITEWDDSIQLGRCLIETRTFAPAALFTAQKTRIADTLATIDRAAVAAASKVCRVPASSPSTRTGPVALGIDALRIETNNARADWALARPSIKKVAAGGTVFLSLYITVRNAPADARAGYQVIVRAGGRVVLNRRDGPFPLSASSTQYRHWVRFIPRSPGSYTVTASVDVANVSATGSVSFTAR